MAAFDDFVDVTVEMGFGSGPLAGSPTWTDVSAYVKAGNWIRGRTSVQSDFPAGSGILWLDNSAGDFYQWNTSGAFSPNITVGTPVRVTATMRSGVAVTEKANSATVTLQGDAELVADSYVLFRGYAARWPTEYPTNSEELAPVEIVESLARLRAADTSKDLTSDAATNAVVSSLLVDVGWPQGVGLTDLGSGVETVQAGVYEGSFMELIRQATEVEQGYFYQSAAGVLVFRNRVGNTFSDSASFVSQATFGPDTGELTYVDVRLAFDDDSLINQARVTAAAGDTQTAEDATSVSAHGPVTFESNNPMMIGEPTALNVAEWIVGRNKDVGPRVVSLKVDPSGDPANLWPVVLDLDLRDIVTVEASFPGSAVQLVQDVAVESVAHSFTAGGVWTVEYGCHPLSDLEQESFWVLGTSDDLDTDTILA